MKALFFENPPPSASCNCNPAALAPDQVKELHRNKNAGVPLGFRENMKALESLLAPMAIV
jgi:phosphopantothenate synthetase